jgi:hypothetical protein
MAGFGTLLTILGVVVVLTLTNLAIGYLFRNGAATTDSGGWKPAGSPQPYRRCRFRLPHYI